MKSRAKGEHSCRRCGLEKPAADFGRSQYGYRQRVCLACWREQEREMIKMRRMQQSGSDYSIRCRCCGEAKDCQQFPENKKNANLCRDCIRARQRVYNRRFYRSLQAAERAIQTNLQQSKE